MPKTAGKNNNASLLSRKSQVGDFVVKKDITGRKGNWFAVAAKNGGQQYWLCKQIASSEKDALANVEGLAGRMALRHENLQNLNDWASLTDAGLCSTSYRVDSFYDFIHSDLASLMQGRTGWEPIGHAVNIHVAYQMFAALDFLHQKGETYGDVRPSNIGRATDALTTWKLLEMPVESAAATTFTIQVDNYIAKNRPLFMAPDLFNAVAKKNRKVLFDQHKSDVFSLGMVCLQAGLKETVQNCYDKKTGVFDVKALNAHRAKFVELYQADNQLLCDIVELATEVNEKERMTAAEFLTKLPVYSMLVQFFNSQHDKSLHSPAKEVHHEKVHVEPAQPTEVHVGHARPDHHVEGGNVTRVVKRVSHHDGVRDSHVSHTDGHRVVRRVVGEPRIVEGGSRVVEGGHRVVGETRVVEGTHTHAHVEPTVVRRSYVQNQGAHVVNEGRRIVTTDPEVRRSVVTNPTVVRRSHVHHGETVVRAHAPSHTELQERSYTRVITDPVEIEKYKAQMAKGKEQLVVSVNHEPAHVDVVTKTEVVAPVELVHVDAPVVTTHEDVNVVEVEGPHEVEHVDHGHHEPQVEVEAGHHDPEAVEPPTEAAPAQAN